MSELGKGTRGIACPIGTSAGAVHHSNTDVHVMDDTIAKRNKGCTFF